MDVEKVEWLNRRSYSAISLFLGREGRVLLRTDTSLEDWFELLEVRIDKLLLKLITNTNVHLDMVLTYFFVFLFLLFFIQTERRSKPNPKSNYTQ